MVSPSSGWFVQHCKDESVKTFDEFVLWCGFDSNKLKNDDEDVALKLKELEIKLGRPITGEDVTLNNVGYTMIVVNRIWGGLINAKEELGLMKTKPCQPKSFEFYQNRLKRVIENIQKDNNRKFISWEDIENPKYSDGDIRPTNHKTYSYAFRRGGIDLFAYIKSLGFQMNPSEFSHRYTFDDGERVVSRYEYDFSDFIRNEIGLTYNRNYKRDVLYRSFADIKTKSNCDYVINISGIDLYIEIAGIINNTKKEDWRTKEFSSNTENLYKDKMIFKEGLLLKHNKPFLFLFPNDMKDDSYKNKFREFVKENTRMNVSV